jgi:hypothetical protein
MQVLRTSKKIILVGVPTNVDSESLGCTLCATMEEARITMVNKNPPKFGAIDKTPRFALSTDFVKNTPYAERSDDNKIPFWAKTPWHLECRESDEGHIEAILSYMYRSGRMAFILDKASFHHLNPGSDATAGERDINAGIVTRHIAMIRSMGRVNLKGLNSPDKPALLQRFDNEYPTKLDKEVNKLVRDVLMRECRTDKTLVWCLVAHSREHEWVGYYRKGVGNDSHQKYAVSWSGSLSAHLRYFLLRRGLHAAGINQLIKQSFNYDAIVDVANAVQKDGKVISREEEAAKQKLEASDKKNSWVDIRLGQTPAQQMAHKQMTPATASEGQYNFDEGNSVDPVGHQDGDTVFTKTRDETLGQTMYNVSSEEGSMGTHEERNFFSHGYKDDDNMGGRFTIQMDVVHQNEAQLAGVLTPKSVLKKPKPTIEGTSTEEEAQEGAGDQINLAGMSLAAPTNATTKTTTGTQPKEGTSDQQEGRDESTAFKIRKPSGDH